MNLLQIVTSDSLNAVSEVESMSVLDLLSKGGWTMVPILILSIVAVYIFIERMLTLQRASKLPQQFMENIKRKVLDGDAEGAKSMCREINSPTAKMIEKGISRLGSPLKNIEASIENVGRIEIYKLEKNLNVLATISGAAPMLGFFGTVLGMIQAFMAIAQEEGSVSPKLLSSGIYEAMITTATGLFVGIIAYIGYNYLITRVQKIIHRMEYNSIEFVDLLQEPN